MVCSAEKDIECAQKIRKMKYFDCQNISPCSGLIMAKTKTKPVEINSSWVQFFCHISVNLAPNVTSRESFGI